MAEIQWTASRRVDFVESKVAGRRTHVCKLQARSQTVSKTYVTFQFWHEPWIELTSCTDKTVFDCTGDVMASRLPATGRMVLVDRKSVSLAYRGLTRIMHRTGLQRKVLLEQHKLSRPLA